MTRKAVAGFTVINDITDQLKDLEVKVDASIIDITDIESSVKENKDNIATNSASITTIDDKIQYFTYKSNINAYSYTKDIDFESNKTIKGLPDPTGAQQVVNKRYADKLPEKSDQFLKWGGYGNTKTWNGNISTSNIVLNNWLSSNRCAEYILILKAGGKDLTFNFHLLDQLQIQNNKVFAQFTVPKNFDSITWGNGNSIPSSDELTNFWLIGESNNLKIKFHNPKNITATIELWSKQYNQF